MKFGKTAALAMAGALSMVGTSATAATTINWTGGSNVNSATQTFGAVQANEVEWLGDGFFHDHFQESSLIIRLLVDGTWREVLSYNPTPNTNASIYLRNFGAIGFAGGTVTGLQLTTNRAVHQNYHGLYGDTFRLNSVNAPVPEPGTWMLMLLGFAAVGAAMRRRNRAKVSVNFA